jgi:hypothetical protein
MLLYCKGACACKLCIIVMVRVHRPAILASCNCNGVHTHPASQVLHFFSSNTNSPKLQHVHLPSSIARCKIPYSLTNCYAHGKIQLPILSVLEV